MNPEFSIDTYDSKASWALSNFWKWDIFTSEKRTGFLYLSKKTVKTIYEHIPVDSVEIWRKTNRILNFSKENKVTLDGNTLTLPEDYQSNPIRLRQRVALELAFICLNIRSHTLPPLEVSSKFSEQDIKEGKEDGGFFGNSIAILSTVGMSLEKTALEQKLIREREEAWKVVSALLIPVNAVCVFSKTGQIKVTSSSTQSYIDTFQVSSDLVNVYFKRVLEKYKKYDNS